MHARGLPAGRKDGYAPYDEARRLDWEDRLRQLIVRKKLLPPANSGPGPRTGELMHS